MISYYDTLCTSMVRQLRLRVVPVKFRLVVVSECRISPLAGHIHEQIALFRILAHFWWLMVNKEVAQFIRACTYFQLVNSCSHEAQQLLLTVESDTPFYVVFMEFGNQGTYQIGIYLARSLHACIV